MSRPRKQLPKYCRHKSSNRAFVRIGGKTYYLGKYGSAASQQEYDRIIAEYVANGRQDFKEASDILIENLIVKFLDYVEKERDYSKTAKAKIIRVVKTLIELYGKVPVSQFNSAALKTIRRCLLDRGLARVTINAYIGTVKQIFYWGYEEEIG